MKYWDESLNFVTGCTPHSSGCQNCYARTMHEGRLKATGDPKYQHPFNEIHFHPEVLDKPLHWKKPRRIFVNSMSDLFHWQVPNEAILDLLMVAKSTPQHTYMILTKRAADMCDFSHDYPFPANVWAGTTIESGGTLQRHRLRNLKDTYCQTKYLSIEPLLCALPVDDMDFSDINWIIVGGETGANARPMKQEWVDRIFEQCQKLKIPFYFKSWGSNSKRKGRLYKGREWNEFPKEIDR